MNKTKNFNERLNFIKFWANHVRTSDDWSKNQKNFLNSVYSNKTKISKEKYIEMKLIIK